MLSPADRSCVTALDTCKKQGATLIIAKLDRLARNVHFVTGLLEAGVDFVAADMPTATKTMIQMYSVMAEFERDQISSRTRAALAAAKARGIQLGTTGPANLRRHVEQRVAGAVAFSERLRDLLAVWRSAGLSQRAIVEKLNELEIGAPLGGAWSLLQLQRVLGRLHSIDSSGNAEAIRESSRTLRAPPRSSISLPIGIGDRPRSTHTCR